MPPSPWSITTGSASGCPARATAMLPIAVRTRASTSRPGSRLPLVAARKPTPRWRSSRICSRPPRNAFIPPRRSRATRAQVARSAPRRASARRLRSAGSRRQVPPRITKSHWLTSSTRSRSRARPVGASNADASKRSISWSRTGGAAVIPGVLPSSQASDRLELLDGDPVLRPPGRLLHSDDVLRDLGRAMVTTRTRAYPQPSHERPREPHPLRAIRGGAARLRALGGLGRLPPRAGRLAAGQLLDRDPAAQRDRGAAHGPRAQRLDPGRADPPRADAGPQHEVDPRHRPRRHRDPDPGRARARRPGDEQGGARARGVPRARVGVARTSTAPRSSPSTSRIGRLAATTTTSASRSTTATSTRS